MWCSAVRCSARMRGAVRCCPASFATENPVELSQSKGCLLHDDQMNGKSVNVGHPVSLFRLDGYATHSTDAQWFQTIGHCRVEYWAIRPSVRSFARTAHSYACPSLLASLARSAALIRSLARSLNPSRRSSWERSFFSTELTRRFHIILNHCAT